jgi:hypothetical protein
MKRMYVLASKQTDYSKPYVQAAHALAQFAIEKPEHFRRWNNHTLIFLSCEDIEREFVRIRSKEEDCIPFYEPDYQNRLTAVCIYTDKKIMGRYKLIEL